MTREAARWEEPRALNAYLASSLALHCLAAGGFLRLWPAGPRKPAAVYTVDFVGPSATILSAAPAPPASSPALQAPAAPAASAPQAEFDEFGRRKRRRRQLVLPRPSLLRGFRESPAAPKALEAASPRDNARSQEPPPAAAQPSPQGPAASPPGDAGVATDMPNFPYPWYISQVRSALWNQWSSRMPKERGECVVVFSLLPDGRVVDLRTEVSSGDAAFDLFALSVVQDAGPYPPLPRGFREPFLKIHVTLKSQ